LNKKESKAKDAIQTFVAIFVGIVGLGEKSDRVSGQREDILGLNDNRRRRERKSRPSKAFEQRPQVEVKKLAKDGGIQNRREITERTVSEEEEEEQRRLKKRNTKRESRKLKSMLHRWICPSTADE
jgi:hypothetical protein